ncbi:PilC/PilY family type IV pilus protein [Ramlibacter sp. PS3R-8]|uniref:pilus assembly protein n=1 Tax=Ramlibacter sp. PS3R-8 TaxID=3133437 RepID=UPI0030AFD10E
MKLADLQLQSRVRRSRAAAALLAGLFCGTVIAATTDIANAPLFTSSNDVVKPNIMFILDDSGSMLRDHMPDSADDFDATEYGQRSQQCNGLAYSPATSYLLPVDHTGADATLGDLAVLDPATQVTDTRSLNNISTWPAAGASVSVTLSSGNASDYFSTTGSSRLVTVYGSASKYFTAVVTAMSSGTMTLKVLAVVGTGSLSGGKIGRGLANTYFTYTGVQKKLGFSYATDGTVITSTTFYKECNSPIRPIGTTPTSAEPGSGVFTPFAVDGGDAVAAQKYANWKAYYTDRMKLMKTAVSRAFRTVDKDYRVGFTTISSTNAVEGTKFLNIRDFDAAQKELFYTKLFATVPPATMTTPLRGALAKAGQYYAKKAPSQTVDPVQYSCQRNFTLLSTDGYWNTGYETSSYGPYKLDGTTLVGQQDGGATLRPMFDGGSVTDTTTETWTVTKDTLTTVVIPYVTTSTVTRSTSTTAPASANAGQRRDNFVLVPEFDVGANLTRAAGVVTVTVAGGHNLVTGDVIDIGGGNSGTFNLSFRADNVSITVISATQFRYNSPGTAGTPAGTYRIFPGGVDCSSGRSVQRTIRETSDLLSTTTTYMTTTTRQPSTSTHVSTLREITPWTRVVKVVNGVQVSDTTTQGALSSSTTTSTPTNVTGTAAVTTAIGTPPAPATTVVSAGQTSWVASTSVSVPSGASCVNNASNPSNVTATNLPSTTSPQAPVSNGIVSSTGPTRTQNGAQSVTPLSTSTVESAHVSTTAATTSGGSLNTLADVAMYYYKTDLRTSGLSNCIGALGNDICRNNGSGDVKEAGYSYGDTAQWQHMTTFTLGLGANGYMTYDPNYQEQTTGDFRDIINNSRNWAAPTASTSGGGPENIDDLWHAAVNGRGKYFSAGDPATLASSLTAVIDTIAGTTGAASAASTSSLQPVQGDNDIYVAQFRTQDWWGDVLSFSISPTSGAISTTTTWSAKARLDLQTPASRTIYYRNPAGGTTLKTFTTTNLSDDGYIGSFENFCSKPGADGGSAPEQCADLDTATKASANTADNLVKFIRGDRTMAYYRSRVHLLGDIINASPLFVGKPGFKYTENDYQTFVNASPARTAVVLAASNDGMLHAFDRLTGDERWAYIPSFVMPKLYKLADRNFTNHHSYFVDGSPQMGDIYVDGAWKTIVVGGLNAGGRGYYALDLTDPANPKQMWEFTNDNLGLSYGNPIITKRSDGTWVVVFASGYNNVSPGDGNGHLFVLDANTGTLLTQVDTFTSGTTAAGDTTTPSGLAKINSWVDSELANVSKRFYGGDILGNLWRFDIDGVVAPNNAALRLAQLTNPDGGAQPVTTKPSVAEITHNGSRYPVVFVGTGKYLGTSDLTDGSVQSLYAMKDPLIDSSYGDVRSNTNFVSQTISASGTARTSTNNAVDWLTKAGWRADLPAGERISVNPQLALETLFVGSNLPNDESCTVGGQSFLYEFSIGSGASSSTYIGNVMIQGLTLVQLTTGDNPGSVVSIITRSDGTLQSLVGTSSGGSPVLRRTSWRELVD